MLRITHITIQRGGAKERIPSPLHVVRGVGVPGPALWTLISSWESLIFAPPHLPQLKPFILIGPGEEMKPCILIGSDIHFSEHYDWFSDCVL